jgi:peptidoglycan/LPS O-acetylase OafA/YrhL
MVGPRHARRRPRRDGYRPDIEGLRAVAVLAVVAYHAVPGWLPGGYVGVDVFFVISGFLITGLLWRELERSGRVSLAGFYARRARRLLPAAMLVLVVTMVASALILPPLQVASVWKDGLACALYVGNYRFAAAKVDYLAPSTPSPFTHYWTLGVEEQFYLLWPLLLVAASLVWTLRRPSRGGAAAGLGVACAGSFALSLWLTRADEPLAFFSLPTRAWELGLGGLLALAVPALRRIPAAAAAALGWAGLAAVAVACGVFGASTAFPGTAALLPVLGAGAVVASGVGGAPGGPVLLLGRAVPKAIGRISYSWYLWHYPVLVLAPYVAGHALSAWVDLALAAGSGLLAVVTFAFVEDPARRARWLSARPRRSLGAGVSLSAAGVATCLLVAVSIPPVAGTGRAPLAVIRAETPAATSTGSGRTHRRQAVDPTLVALDAAQAQVHAAVDASASPRPVPANLDPPLADAAASEAAPMIDGCLLGFTETTQPDCLFGDPSGRQAIVLFGDSHAAMWFPAVDAYANAHHDRLYVWTKATCPPVDIDFFSPALAAPFTQCRSWRTADIAAMARLRPVLVVFGIAPNYDAAYDVVQNGPAWLVGLRQAVSEVRATGARVLVMGSVPSPPFVVPDCLSAHLGDAAACDFAHAGRRISGGGLDGVLPYRAEQAAVVEAGGRYADVVPWFCAPQACVAVVDNLLVYRDNSHITVPYATYLAPLVADEMALALRR